MEMPTEEEAHPLDGRLEIPGDSIPLGGSSDYALMSIAISMKRIADAMHGDTNGVGIRDSIWAISDRMPTGS